MVEAFPFQHFAAAEQARAFLFTRLDVAQHVLAVREAHQRSEVGAFSKQIAGADTRHAGEDFLFKCRFQAPRNEYPGAVGADLA